MDGSANSAGNRAPGASVARTHEAVAAGATDSRVSQQLATIKAHMPETYKLIQAWAQEIGNEAFRYVRRGCSGEPDCFWACEAGHVVGTPFAMQAINDDVARYMVRFGCTFVAVRADGRGNAGRMPASATPPVQTSAPQEAAHGTH